MAAFDNVKFEMAFDDGPFVAVPTFTNLRAYVHEIDITECSRPADLDTFEAGTLEVVLNNNAALFDPLNTVGTYYGKLLPRKQVRVTAVDSGAKAKTLFRGFVLPVDGWEIDYSPPLRSVVTVRATDLIGILATMNLPTVGTSWLPTLRSTRPRILYRCNEASGTTIADTSGNGHNGTLSGSATFEKDDPLIGDTDPAIQIGDSSTANGRWSVPSGGFTPTTGSWTVAAWVYPRKTGVESVVFYGEDGSGKKIRLSIGESWAPGYGNMRMAIDAQTFTSNEASDLVSWLVIPNQWNFCVWTYDATTGLAKMVANPHFFSASVTDFWEQKALTAYTGGNFTNEAWVGGDNGAANAFYGDLDEVTFWHEAVPYSIIQILSDAARGVASPDPAPLYEGELSGSRVRRVLAMCGIPQAWWDVDDGLTYLEGTLFGGNALETLQKIALSEGGAVYAAAGSLIFDDRLTPWLQARQTTSQATFSDDGAGVGYSVRGFGRQFASPIVNRARHDTDNIDLQEYADSASIDEFGEVEYEQTGLFMRDAPEAFARSELIVKLYKDPVPHPRQLMVQPGRSSAALDQACNRKARDRVTVELNPPGTTTPSQYAEEVIVEKVAHKMTAPARSWDTTFEFTSASRYDFIDGADFGTLDTDTWEDSADFSVFAP